MLYMFTGCYLGKLTRFMKLIQLHRVNYVVFFYVDSSSRYFAPEKPLISNNFVKKISFSSEQQWISKFKPFGQYFR